MKSISLLDPTALRAFYHAASTLSFTKAAEKAALTQSGVSQHIAKIEEELGVDLFLRVGRSVQLTPAGLKLRQFVEEQVTLTEALVDELRAEGAEVRGLVRYAMPDSCLMTPHFRMLLEKRRKFQGVDLRVTICDSSQVMALLRAGEIDFGFVTQKYPGQDVLFEEFAREKYVLVGGARVTLDSPKDLMELDFVKYPGVEVLLERWQQAQYPRYKTVDLTDLKVRGEITSLSAALTMVEMGVGYSVFPMHCAERITDKKGIQVVGRNDNRPENESPIYLVSHSGAKYPARIRKVMDSFWEMSKISRG